MGILGGVLLSLVGLVMTQDLVKRIPSRPCLNHASTDTVYNYALPDFRNTQNVTLSKYRGLNALQTKYSNDLVVVGVPCNQFGKQEPGVTPDEIWNGIKYVRPGGGFEPNFKMMSSKVNINGAEEHPLYTFLKKYCPATRDGFAGKDSLNYEPLRNWDVRWNFEKFLIDCSGHPVARFDPSTHPDDIDQYISQLIRDK